MKIRYRYATGRTSWLAFAALLGLATLTACSNDAMNWRPNRGTEYVNDEKVRQRRGGSQADWNLGNGQPGSAARIPTDGVPERVSDK